MDLVSNFVGTLSASVFGGEVGITKPNLNIEDKTFSDMLEEKINDIKAQNKIQSINSDIPIGMDIGDLDGHHPIFEVNSANISDAVKPIDNYENSVFYNFNNREDFSTPEVLTFYNSIFDKKPTLTDSSNCGLFDFERKIAAGYYSKYAKNIVTDLSEFVTDALKIN